MARRVARYPARSLPRGHGMGGNTGKGGKTGNAGKGGKTGKGGKKATSVDDLPLAVTRASAEGPRRIELCTVSGNLLPATELYSKILISRRSQRPDFELEELLRPCAAYLKWPLSHIHLVCGKIIVRWHHRIAERTRTPCWQPGEHGARRVTVVKEAMPEVFGAKGLQAVSDAQCICEFGGCCRLCQVLHRGFCPGCGSGPGCCLCANCGCDCCESENPPVLPDDAPRCPFHGCQPEWAARPTVGEDQSGASVGHLG